MARIDNPEFISDEMKSLFRNVGVDTLVYPEHFAAKEISTALEYSWLRYRYSLHDGQIIVAGVRIPEGAPVDGMELREFGKERHRFHVSAIRRGGRDHNPLRYGRDTGEGHRLVHFGRRRRT